MKILNNILKGLLALMMSMPGVMKLISTKDKLLEGGEQMAWVVDFAPITLKIIGSLEILAVLGLVLPFFTKIPKKFSMYAALGVICLMTGAMATHIGRGEPVYFQGVILLIAGTVSWLTYKQNAK